ncbi:MAG: hypothetical protein ACFB22_03490 [Rhodothalassiaceae bacterium]
MEDHPGPERFDLEGRVDRLEADMREVKPCLARMEPKLAEIDGYLKGVLPSVATKEQIDPKLSAIDSYLKGVLPSLAKRDEIEPRLGAIDGYLKGSLPSLATKDEVAQRPTRAELYGVLALYFTLLAIALAALS